MKQRINVTISDVSNEKLDTYSARYGISKSGLVGFIVGQWIDQMERINESVYGSMENQGLLEKAFKQISIDDLKNE